MELSIAIKETGEITRDIDITIPREVYRASYKTRLSGLTKQVRLKGFRQGHVPPKVVDQMYGSKVHQEVLVDCSADAIDLAVKKHGLKVVGSPTLKDFPEPKSLSQDEDILLVASVEILPTLNIQGYFGIEAKVDQEEFSEKLVDREVERLVERYTSIEEDASKTEVELGALITASIEAEIEGKAVPELAREDCYIDVGSELLPEGLSEGLIGMKLGETRAVKTKLKEDAENPAMSGKEALFTVTCKLINKKIVPVVDDNFLIEKDVDADMASYRANLEVGIRSRIEGGNREKKEKAVFKALIEKNPFSIPQVVVDEYIRDMLFKLSFLDPRKKESRNVDMSRFRDLFGEQGEFRAKVEMIVEHLCEQEEFLIRDEDVTDEEIRQHLERSRSSDIAFDQLKRIADHAWRTSFVAEVKRDKLIEKILAQTKFEINLVESKA